MQPAADNARGFFESARIADLNDRLLPRRLASGMTGALATAPNSLMANEASDHRNYVLTPCRIDRAE